MPRSLRSCDRGCGTRRLHPGPSARERVGRPFSARARQAQPRCRTSAAESAYQRWGATAKVHALSEELPALAEARSSFGPTVSWRSSQLSARPAQRDQGERDHFARARPDPLIARLMAVCLEVAGAERGALVLEQEGEPMLRAVARAASRSVSKAPYRWRRAGSYRSRGGGDAAHRRCPGAGRTRRRIARFAEDPYIAERQVRSVLAVPMLRQATVIGVLYLENNLATRAFGPSRVRILQTLSSQLAISLAHSRLFEELDARSRRASARAGRGWSFSRRAARPLGESLDYRATLAKTAAQVRCRSWPMAASSTSLRRRRADRARRGRARRPGERAAAAAS